METIEDIKKALTIDFDSLIDDIMAMPSIKKEIIELNQKEQLSEGVDALDQKIRTISAAEQNQGNVYSTYTIAKRAEQGLQTDNVDLKVTGAFYNTFDVKKVQGGWEVVANFDVHSDNILDNFENKYDFLGLTDENLDYFVFNSLLPELQKKINAIFK